MMKKTLAAINCLVIAPFLLGGCLGSSSSTPAGSPTAATSPACTFTVTGSTTECILYLASIGQTAITTACSAVSGTTSATCSATSRLGVCAVTSSQTTSAVTYYSGGIYTNTTAQTDCTTVQGGAYTSG